MKQSNLNDLYFTNLVYLARRDGTVCESEMVKLLEVAEKLGLSVEFVNTCIKGSKDIQFINPENHRDKLETLYGYIDLMEADGKIDPEEESACLLLCKQMEIDTSYYYSAINKRKVAVG